MTSPDYGIHAFLGVSPQSREQQLQLAKGAGFNWVKQDFRWSDISPDERGVFKWEQTDAIVEAANKAGVKLLARVGSPPKWAAPRDNINDPPNPPPSNLRQDGDFANFMFGLAMRYKGRIGAYQVWNEPNLNREWGKRPDATEYVQLLKVAYTAIKAADPNALVISAGPSPTTASGEIATPDTDYIQQMYDAMAGHSSNGYFDLLGVHGSGYKAPPDTSPEEIARNPLYNHNEPGLGRIYGFRHVEDLRKVMEKNGDSKKRIAVLEFGWTTDNRPGSPYAWHGVSESEQADYLVQAYNYAQKNWPWVGVMVVIYLAHPLWTPQTEEYYWAITLPDGTPRPAYNKLKEAHANGTLR